MKMHAMLMKNSNEELIYTQIEKPFTSPRQILIKVTACGICRTDLHVVDGELKHPKLPLVPGHQIIGVIEALGEEVKSFTIGQRIGVPWLGGSCEVCQFCLTGRENLCDQAQFTGSAVIVI